MIATRIRQRLESDTIHLSDAAAFIGKDVEIIIIMETADQPPVQNPREKVAGSAKGVVSISDDFDAPLPNEILEGFSK
ncbi:MAG: hypothetical protein NTX50_17605 [Candidatus Sumerlaeota bacterium]|nr:hypothetical protein [Candidatus Sumerlaeota bacterium]